MREKLYINNSNVVELRSLTNSVTGSADTGATVRVTIYDDRDDAISGETWPVSMSHVSAGTYRATLSSALVLTHNGKYTAVVTVAGTGGEVGSFRQLLVALQRADDC